MSPPMTKWRLSCSSKSVSTCVSLNVRVVEVNVLNITGAVPTCDFLKSNVCRRSMERSIASADVSQFHLFALPRVIWRDAADGSNSTSVALMQYNVFEFSFQPNMY